MRLSRTLPAFVIAALPLAPAFAQESTPTPQQAEAGRVVVTGTGEASLKPDIARLSLGVTEEAPSAEEALSTVAERLDAALATLREAGIAPADIRTARIDVSPVYEYDDNGRRPPTRFQASSSLEVTIRDLTTLGETLDAAAQAGANEIGGFAFDATDRSAALEEARMAAIADARLRAETYAEAAGVAIGALMRIDEGGGAQPGPMPVAEMRAMDSGAAMPVAPGEITVSASVTLTYGF